MLKSKAFTKYGPLLLCEQIGVVCTFSLYPRLGYQKLPEIILFTDIEDTAMIEQAFVLLIDMSSYLWHGRYVEYSRTRFDDEISLSLRFPN